MFKSSGGVLINSKYVQAVYLERRTLKFVVRNNTITTSYENESLAKEDLDRYFIEVSK